MEIVKPPKFLNDRAKRFGKEKKTLRYTPPRCICNMLRLGTCEYLRISPCQQTESKLTSYEEQA